MADLTTPAYVSWGQWVAQCGNPGCTNALTVERGQTAFVCTTANGVGACGAAADLLWPTDPSADAIEAAMNGRTPAFRSWQPGQELS